MRLLSSVSFEKLLFMDSAVIPSGMDPDTVRMILNDGHSAWRMGYETMYAEESAICQIKLNITLYSGQIYIA